jgi:hypothetical protein
VAGAGGGGLEAGEAEEGLAEVGEHPEEGAGDGELHGCGRADLDLSHGWEAVRADEPVRLVGRVVVGGEEGRAQLVLGVHDVPAQSAISVVDLKLVLRNRWSGTGPPGIMLHQNCCPAGQASGM